jgi:hypothetical protein
MCSDVLAARGGSRVSRERRQPRDFRHGLLALLCLLAACSEETTSPEADAIRDQLDDADYRRSFARAPGWDMPRQSAAGGPHGAFVDIYVNEVVAEALEAGAALERWPDGALIVKDGWDDADGETYLFLAFMERRPEGWFWGEYRGDGSLVAAGVDDPTCANCHSAGQDSVFAFGLPTGE